MVGCYGPAEGHVVIVVARRPGVKHLPHTQRPLEPGQGERGAGVQVCRIKLQCRP